MANINPRLLVKGLKNMEANGLVERKVYAAAPSTVEYTLTPKGRKLEPILCALHQWGEEYMD